MRHRFESWADWLWECEIDSLVRFAGSRMVALSEDRTQIDWFDIAFRLVRLFFTFALATVAGYAVLGGLLGFALLFAGAKSWIPYAGGLGWCLGGLVAIGNECSDWFRDAKREKWLRDTDEDSTEEPIDSKKESRFGKTDWNTANHEFRMPSIGGFLKSFSIGGLVGAVLGLFVSVAISLVLFSVVTCPLAPQAWRPTPSANHGHASKRHRTSTQRRSSSRTKVRASSSFTHPLLGPIVMGSVGTVAVLGFIAGGTLCFFPEVEKGKSKKKEPDGS